MQERMELAKIEQISEVNVRSPKAFLAQIVTQLSSKLAQINCRTGIIN